MKIIFITGNGGNDVISTLPAIIANTIISKN